ncbi:MAG: helix-turn-helix transcriptional regulator [Bacillales bacterium]|jgi:DNA-binding XRE family transcriptional regulator|nr:helix-turn-helix transcriptional regulator [Bacillales bacterium]
MIHAYNELYLNKAMHTLGDMFQYAICNCRYKGNEVLDLFINTKIAVFFESGDPKYVAGCSGQELFCDILKKANKPYPPATLRFFLNKTPEYWCGWILAYYQWFYNTSFKEIQQKLKYNELYELYPTLHEVDMTKAIEVIRKRISIPTKLQTFRKSKGLSQAQLALLSGVSLRSIQMYEQRFKDINKASGDTLRALAKILLCSIEEIFE